MDIDSSKQFNLFESEMLTEPISFPCHLELKGIGLQPNEITISRGDHYEIVIKAKGNGVQGKNYLKRDVKRGQPIPTEDYEFLLPAHKITLHQTYGNGLSIRGDGDFELGLTAYKVSWENDFQTNAETLVEYFIGCPDIMFSGGTERELNTTASLKRFPSSEAEERSFNSKSGSMARDSDIYENKFGKILLCKYPKTRSDNGSCYLEYSGQPTGFDKTFRDSWSETISFFLGKRLMSVGFKTFSKENFLKYQESYWTYSPNFSREINSPPSPPVNCNNRGFSDTKLMSNLIELYLENRSKLNLSDVLDNLWLGRVMPTGPNLMAFSSALESLINAWFKLGAVRDSGLLVDNAEFELKTSTWFDSFAKSLPDHENWKTILKKIKNSNFVVGSDKFKKFFNEIHLPIGPVEKAVIDSRHKLAHGGSLEGEELRKYILLGRGYQTLISRCILKTIGYNGSYIDYSTYDFPERNIDEPLGGPEGDQKI